MVAEKASEDPRKVTLRDDVARRLDDVAKATGKTRDELVNEAVTAELEEHDRFIAAVEEGRASLARGERIAWADVKTELAEQKARFRREHGL